MSPLPNSGVVTTPVKKPRPSGLNGTNATFSSSQVASSFFSTSRVHSEYSDCTAAMGWTAWARRSVSLDTSESPSARTLPARTSSAMAPTVSSTGTRASTRCR